MRKEGLGADCSLSDITLFFKDRPTTCGCGSATAVSGQNYKTWNLLCVNRECSPRPSDVWQGPPSRLPVYLNVISLDLCWLPS